jgi:hypothetical protein
MNSDLADKNTILTTNVKKLNDELNIVKNDTEMNTNQKSNEIQTLKTQIQAIKTE